MSKLRKIIDVLLTLIAVILVVFALIWFVYTFDVFELPQFVLNIIEHDESVGESVVGYESDLLSLIESESYIDDSYSYVTVTADKAERLLSSIKPSDNYFWLVETKVTHGNRSRTQQHYVYKKGELTRIDTEENGNVVTNIFAKGKGTVIDNATGEINEFSGDTDFSYSNLVNIAALDGVFDVGGNVAVNYIAVVTDGTGKYIYVEMPKENVNGSDKFFISLDHGIVTYASSSIDGIEYFTQKTMSFDDATVVSDDAFEITYSEKGEVLTLQ